MPEKGNVFVNINDSHGGVYIRCVIEFTKPIKEFRFRLGLPLQIDSINADAEISWLECDTQKAQMPTNPDIREIVVDSVDCINSLDIRYSGLPRGWLNAVDDTQIALFWSSSWRVFNTSVPVEFDIVFENATDYDVWEYYSTGIFAFKKGVYHSVACGDFTSHCIKQEHVAYGELLAEHYNKIIAFYSSLYYPVDLGRFEALIMDIKDSEGALIGESLLIIGKVPDFADAEQMRHHAVMLIGHEFGHAWFGADWSSWEVWLGETGAEWSMLLYLLTEGDTQCFESRIEELRTLEAELDEIDDSYVIKTADLSCPEFGAHSRGTLLFYEVYRRYGLDVIKTILQTMGTLKKPDTDMLLTKLRATLGDEIPNLIEQGLTARDYSAL